MNKTKVNGSKPASLPESVRVQAAPAVDKNAAKKLRFITDKSAQSMPTGLTTWINACRIAQIVGWAASGLSSFAFLVILSTPILLPILTFGTCGLGEWKEFAATAIQMSFYPGITAVLSAGLGLGAKRMLENLHRRFDEELKQNQELRMLEDLLKPSTS